MMAARRVRPFGQISSKRFSRLTAAADTRVEQQLLEHQGRSFSMESACPHCQNAVSPGARFCGNCGKQIPAPVASVATQPAIPAIPQAAANAHPQWINKGFLKSLFDVSFSSFVTTKVVKLIYVLTLIWIGLWAIGWIVWAFERNSGLGALFLLVVAPLVSLFIAVYSRMVLEFIIAVFRIAEYQRDQLSLTQRQVALAEQHSNGRPADAQHAGV
jgi:hypothetical protein